jgi:hypothetical protein
MATAYDELVDFLAAGTTPDDLVAFQPSESTRLRVAELVAKEKEDRLSVEERSEMENYMQLEHLMRLAKAKARKHLQHAG